MISPSSEVVVLVAVVWGNVYYTVHCLLEIALQPDQVA
jgi:hypothetical protein